MGARGPASDLPRRLERHLLESDLIPPGSVVVVALSGGLDSLVLLHLLRFRLPALARALSAAHLDHAMRPGSARDAAWVRGVCVAWGVPLALDRLAAPPVSEAAARDRRYAFLYEVAPPDSLICTAHHLDDQAETVYFRAIRGAGVRGLRGIAPRRGRIVRPLLPFTRRELEAYARESGLRWREDPTNRDLSFARNRIRHTLLPALEAARPGAIRTLAALADRARESERRWEPRIRRLARAATLGRDRGGLALARDVLRSYHPAVRARVLRFVLRRFGSMPGRAGTRAALEFINSGPSGGRLDLAGGVRIRRDFDTIRVDRSGPPLAADRGVRIPDRAAGRARLELGGKRYAARWGAGGLDGEKTGVPEDAVFPLELRGWAPGDRIRLAYGSKKLKKLFAERRVDRQTRASVPVLADAHGRILWVAGVARAEGVPAESAFEIAVGDA